MNFKTFIKENETREFCTFVSEPKTGEFKGYAYNNRYLSICRVVNGKLACRSVKIKTDNCPKALLDAVAKYDFVAVNFVYDQYTNVIGVNVLDGVAIDG